MKSCVPYNWGQASDYICDGDYKDDLYAEKLNNYAGEGLADDIGFRSRTSWGPIRNSFSQTSNKVIARNCLPYNHSPYRESDYLCDGDRFDDLKPELGSNFNDHIVEDDGFGVKMNWGQSGYSQVGSRA